MGGRKSKFCEVEDPHLMDRRRPFNTPSGTPTTDSSSGTFSTDLFMKIGTRVATVTAVYERIANRQHLPLPPLPIESPPSAINDDGYEVPRSVKK